MSKIKVFSVGRFIRGLFLAYGHNRNDFIPWKPQNDVTTTRCGGESDCDVVNSDTANSFVAKIGDQDTWRGRVGLIHKELSVNERMENLDKFKSGQLKVLICTDLGSRGLDIPDVTHVIQLDFAPNATAVLHKTGRTARAGSSGKGKKKLKGVLELKR